VIRSTLGIYQFSRAVGAVVLICVVLFVAALINAGLLKEWFQASLTRRIRLPESGVSGLSPGASVQIMGTKAGEVRRIVIDPSGRMHAEARVETQMRPFIRRDSKVSIGRQFGIAGNAFIEISRGTGQELDWSYAVLEASDEKATGDTIGDLVEDVQKRVVPIMDELHKAIANLNAMAEPMQKIMQSTAAVAGRLERGEGSAGRVLADEKMANDLAATIAAAQQSVGHANNLLAELEKTSKDQRLQGVIERTEAVLASLQTVTRNLAAASPQFSQMTTGITTTTEAMPALLLQTQTTAHELELLLGQLRRSWLLGGGGKAASPPPTRRAPPGEVRP
jgi:phospholipid/cholesterol/gamma-HCH transport system substrate-binding protein